MKVLLVHNFYGSTAPSGENLVFEAEKALLEKMGHTVLTYTRHSDEIRRQGMLGAIKGALAVPWNPFSATKILKVLDEFKPDVVHAHNTFPLISPSVFHAIGQRAATVMTLHNYRLLCSAAIPMRDGKVCTDCIDRQSVLPALQHGCYRDSRVATLPLAANAALHRALGTWHHQVDAFIALSEFQKNLLGQGGLPVEKIHVKPNFYAGNPVVLPMNQRDEQVVFVGRLGEEKGVRTLIKAWQQWGAAAPLLRMIGDGPLREELQQQAKGLPIEFMGQISATDAQAQIAKARLLVLPSEWFETFGLVLIEAFSAGTPAAVSNLGPLPSIVKHGDSGVVFESANPSALLQAVQQVMNNPAQLEHLGLGARQSFETLYNEEANYQALMQIYVQAIAQNESRKS